MDAFHTPISSFQGGSNYQGMHQNYVLPGIQPSHQNYPPVQNVSQSASLTIPNIYQLPNLNGNNQITLTGLNGPVNMLPCLNQGTNFMPIIVNNTNSISYNYNGQILPIENSQASRPTIIPQSQTLHTQKINAGTSTVNISGVNNDKTENISKKVGKGGSCNGKKSEGTNTSVQGIKCGEKIGNISMDITSIFPLHSIPVRKILDLNIMGCLLEIKNLNVSLHDRLMCKGKFLDALQEIVRNKTLLHWFILKCEEKQISVTQRNIYMELYTVDDFKRLFEAIDKESCLPLPYITKGLGDKRKYFYLNLIKGSCNKVRKLNSSIFCDVNEKKKIMCRYPGIKLHCTFSETMKDFTIHVHESAMPVYRSSAARIKELVIYKHVVWGFLQSWVRLVKKHFKDFFTEEQISKNLFLQQMDTLDGGLGPESENIPVYIIGHSNLYLKFDPVNSKQARDSFSVKNFEAKFVCDFNVVQYYRQFFLLHDVRSVHVLNCVVLFFSERVRMAEVQHEQNSSKDKTLQKWEKGSIVPSVPEKIRIAPGRPSGERIDLPSISSGAGFSVTGTNMETPGTYFAWHTSERVEDSVGNQKNGYATEPKEGNVAGTLQTPLARPLLKTRTVEEINSSIEANKKLGFYPISFDSVGKVDVGTDARDQSNPVEFATLVREALENCYSMSPSEVTALDETNDENVISERVKEAVDGAMGSTSLESFIGAIYGSLQVHFTNSTSRKILNTMIERAMKKNYPGFENIVAGSRSAVQTCVDKPSGEYKSRLLKMVKEALATEESSFDLTEKTAAESGNSCVPLNLPVQVPQQKENLRHPLPKEVVLQEQKRETNVEPCTSKPSGNAESSKSQVLSKEKESSDTKPGFSVTVKKENVEGAEPTPPGEDALPSLKDENKGTSDNNVKFKCKTEVPDYPTGSDAGGKAPKEEPISPRENTKSEPIKNEPEIKAEPGAETNETSEPDSKHRPVKSNARDIEKFKTSCDEEEEEDVENKAGVLDSLQLGGEMKKHVVVKNECEPGRKRRRRNDSDMGNSEICTRARERLRKRSGTAEACPTKSKTGGTQSKIAKGPGKKFGDCEEAKENVFFHGRGFKKELKILLRRLEDTPEYKKYAEDYGPNLQFKVRKVGFKNKNRPEGFEIVGIKRLVREYGSLKRRTNRK